MKNKEQLADFIDAMINRDEDGQIDLAEGTLRSVIVNKVKGMINKPLHENIEDDQSEALGKCDVLLGMMKKHKLPKYAEYKKDSDEATSTFRDGYDADDDDDDDGNGREQMHDALGTWEDISDMMEDDLKAKLGNKFEAEFKAAEEKYHDY